MTSLLQDVVFTRAANSPRQPAVISSSGTLSYARLAQLGNALADGLIQHGLEPESLVAVCVDRSISLPICLLGILAAGCAYLPLDPSHPLARRSQILAAARAALVITDEQNHDEMSRVHSHVVRLDDFPRIPGTRHLRRQRPRIHPDHLAYVIYTSGSTGEPKGVEIAHAAAMNTISNINSLCAVNCDDRVFNVSPVSFDLSVYDFLGAWAAGATVVVSDKTAYPEPKDWSRLMRRAGVTIWNSAPALLEMLLDFLDHGREAASDCMQSLRRVLLSGDRISPRLITGLRRVVPGARILAMGGATEVSIWSVHQWAECLGPDIAFVPYGTALPNQTTMVLDSSLHEVPTGESGLLHIGGMGVARGYRGCPELTAAAFIPDASKYGARLYCTGDRVRRLQRGNLEFLGRDDRQLKIRGSRIEIAEIETALLTIETLQQVAVVPIESAQGIVLCACLVTKRGHTNLQPSALRELISTRLPVYMVPDRYWFLDQMPLTDNGKIDRNELRRYSVQQIRDRQTDVVPRISTGITTDIQATWSEVLELDNIDPTGHFIDLGGNSVLASRIANRLSETFQLEVTVRDIFESPTIEVLSALVDERLAEKRAVRAN